MPYILKSRMLVHICIASVKYCCKNNFLSVTGMMGMGGKGMMGMGMGMGMGPGMGGAMGGAMGGKGGAGGGAAGGKGGAAPAAD